MQAHPISNAQPDGKSVGLAASGFGAPHTVLAKIAANPQHAGNDQAVKNRTVNIITRYEAGQILDQSSDPKLAGYAEIRPEVCDNAKVFTQHVGLPEGLKVIVTMLPRLNRIGAVMLVKLALTLRNSAEQNHCAAGGRAASHWYATAKSVFRAKYQPITFTGAPSCCC